MIGGIPHYGSHRPIWRRRQELSSRLAADRLGGGEEALLQASLVEHFEQGLSETKKDARSSAA